MNLSPDRKLRVLAAVEAIPAPTRVESQRRLTWLVPLTAIAMLIAWFGVPPLMHSKMGLAHALGRPDPIALANVLGCVLRVDLELGGADPRPFALMAFFTRRIEPRVPGLTGAALGSAAAAWAGAMVVLWCPLAEPGHVARGHMAPFVVLTLCGALLGRRLFSMR